MLRLRSLPTDGHRDPDRSVRTFPPAIVGDADEPGVTAEASLLAKPVNLCRSGPGGWCESFCHRTVAHQRHDVPWGDLPQVWRVRVGFVVVVSLGVCGGVGSSSSVVVRVKTTGTTPTALARGSSSRSRESISVVTFPRLACRRWGSGLGSSVVVWVTTPQARVCTACLGDSSCRGRIRQYRTRPAGDSGGMVAPDRWAANTEPVVQRVVQSCCAAPTPRRS